MQVPHVRCLTVLTALAEMSDPLHFARCLSTVTITYARRMHCLAEEKVRMGCMGGVRMGCIVCMGWDG